MGGSGGQAVGGQGGALVGGQGGAVLGGQGGALVGGQGGAVLGGQGGALVGGQGGASGLACSDAPVPTDCEAAHGYFGCCVGSIIFYWYGDAVQSEDCAAYGLPCGWADGYGYTCGGDGADPAEVDGQCCGGANPYGDCPFCVDGLVPTDCNSAHGFKSCCVGTIVYRWEDDALWSYDCADEGLQCGWDAPYWEYACVPESSPDPTYPDHACCGSANPYGNCTDGACWGMLPPSSCETTHGATGCCADNVRYYWDGSAVTSEDCSVGGRQCAWSDVDWAYSCTPGGSADPAHPEHMCCATTNPYGGCGLVPDCSTAPAPTDCNTAHGYLGCCVGTVYYFWIGGLDSYDCAEEGLLCGWDDQLGFYACTEDGLADPTHPDDICCGGTNPYGDCD